MNACIAGCIFSSVLPNSWKGIGALKIHGRYGDYTVCAFDVIVFTFRIGQQKVALIECPKLQRHSRLLPWP
jgi:hypothetical protein